MVVHVVRDTSCLVHLLHARVDRLVFRLEQREHVLRHKPMDGYRFQLRILFGQRVIGAHLEPSILHRQMDMVCFPTLLGELDVAEVETRRVFLDGDLGERWCDSAVDVSVRGRLVGRHAVEEGVQVSRLKVAEPVTQCQGPLLRLVEESQHGDIAKVSGDHRETLTSG